MTIKLKRVYEDSAKEDGRRILVDRIWPRGLTKAQANADVWLKEVGPSSDLRKWFNHEPDKWPEFKRRYAVELKANPAFTELRQLVDDSAAVTLVYGAKDTERNQAVVLKELLQKSR